MKAATCEAAEICARLKVAREALGLTQAALADAVGGSKRGIQDNETRNRVPGGEVICGLVRLGINANWLLTGEGPMFLVPERSKAELLALFCAWRKQHQDLDDKAAVSAYVDAYNGDQVEHVSRLDNVDRALLTELLVAWRLDKWNDWADHAAKPPPINDGALAMILAGILMGMGERPDPERAARKAVQYYQDALAEGLITPTGLGAGGRSAA